jgi:hypothetical protein
MPPRWWFCARNCGTRRLRNKEIVAFFEKLAPTVVAIGTARQISLDL